MGSWDRFTVLRPDTRCVGYVTQGKPFPLWRFVRSSHETSRETGRSGEEGRVGEEGRERGRERGRESEPCDLSVRKLWSKEPIGTRDASIDTRKMTASLYSKLFLWNPLALKIFTPTSSKRRQTVRIQRSFRFKSDLKSERQNFLHLLLRINWKLHIWYSFADDRFVKINKG